MDRITTMSQPNIDATSDNNLGTARKPVYNPVTFMWTALIGVPGFLIFMILYKLSTTIH